MFTFRISLTYGVNTDSLTFLYPSLREICAMYAAPQKTHLTFWRKDPINAPMIIAFTFILLRSQICMQVQNSVDKPLTYLAFIICIPYPKE